MTLLALLVSTDDAASEVLGRVLPAAGIAVERFSDLATAVDRMQQQRFDAIVVDFAEPESANAVLEQARRQHPENSPITVALLSEPARTRAILSDGAHFVLYKPLSDDKARIGLRAVAALLNRERRRAFRVPVQAPVELSLPDTRGLEGILLDLSETGMDVLTAVEQTPGALMNFSFQLPGESWEVRAHGQVAWANPNGQTGIHFLDIDEPTRTQLRAWLHAAAAVSAPGPEETVPHCKLTDLSLGGCYVESDSPFPQRSLIDVCLRAGEVAIHTEGMVRVSHPAHGMGVEFTSRTPEQRAQVGNLISFLRNRPESMLEVSVSPRALVADPQEFERPAEAVDDEAETLEDPLLELLRTGCAMQQEDFLGELRRQRSGESVAN